MKIGQNINSINNNIFKFQSTQNSVNGENKSLSINNNKSISKEKSLLEEQITKIKESNLSPEEKKNKIQEIEDRLSELQQQEAKKQLEEQKKLLEKAVEESKKNSNTEDDKLSDALKGITASFQDLDMCSRLRGLQALHPDRKERIQKFINEKISSLNERTYKINQYIKNIKTEDSDSNKSIQRDEIDAKIKENEKPL